MIDLLVAGGGPAGLATAILATLAGLQAVVVESKDGVIDKACGEGLMPPAVAALERMGVAVSGHPFAGIRYVDGDRRAEARFRQGPGLGVRRTELHRGLLARAAGLDVPRMAGTVVQVRQQADRVEVEVATPDGRSTTETAAFLVAADGLHSRLRRRFNLGLPPHHPSRYGIRRHFAMAPWSEFVEVHWSPRAEAYVTPVAADCVGVAILFAGKGSFEDWLPAFPALQQRLHDPCTPAMGGGPFEQRVRRRVEGRLLLVGDAAGFLDPLTGEGLRLGLLAADALVRCVRSGQPARYEAAWSRLTSHYWLLTSALLWLQRWPPTRRSIVPVLERCPALFDWGLHYLMS